VPDSAHGTNPATAAMAGMKVVEIKSDRRGNVDLDDLSSKLSPRAAGLMLTNPNTLGLFEENVQDAMVFARMLEALYRLPKPTIARINGACMGGGVGLVSACDIAVSVADARFALREILLGIAPAAISPYVLRKIGESNAHDYFLTGRIFDAETARTIGLINEVSDITDIDLAVERWVHRFLKAGPKAIAATKQLINRVSWSQLDQVQEYTARTIAGLRGSDEGQEGFNAFFEKRKPGWDPEA